MPPVLSNAPVQVEDIKAKLSGLSEQMDEARAVCRQLHSHLKRFPDCREAPFEAEADTLMDTWLDVSAWTSTIHLHRHHYHLRVKVSVWQFLFPRR